MIGDLLGTSGSIGFSYLSGFFLQPIERGGSASITTTKIAENESPLPRDRVGYAFNLFHDAQSVTGPTISPPGTGIIANPGFTRTQDVLLNRFFAEKTFFNGQYSAQIRIPIANALGNDQTYDLVYSEQTLGERDVQFGDLTLVQKLLLMESRTFALTAGFGTVFPTQGDINTTVVDRASSVYATNDPRSPDGFNGNFIIPRNFPAPLAQARFGADQFDPLAVPGQQIVVLDRFRSFNVDPGTYSLSPFLAGLWTPDDRTFVQGFAQVALPVGRDRIRYRDRLRVLDNQAPDTDEFATFDDRRYIQGGDIVNDASATIRQQALMHLDIGVGRWIYRDPDARFLTGIAPVAELHYTTTLENAEVVTLPATGLVQQTTLRPEAGPTVGNTANRIDLLNTTLGTTFQFGRRTTLATAVALPISNGTDRAFDWELSAQLNFYFGRTLQRRPTLTPNFQ